MLKYFLLFLSLILSVETYAGGVLIGNGGNIIRCSGDSHFQSLDFIISRNMFGNKVKIIPAASLNQSLKRIESLLNEKLPQLVDSFRDFTNSIKNKNKSPLYSWQIPPYGIGSIIDEISPIPFRCRNSLGGVEIYQTIIRYDYKYDDATKNKVVFKYDPDALKLIENNYIQMSFLMVHEWLWGYTSDIKVNRKLNYYLHSTLFNSVEASEAESILKSYGLKIED